MVKLCPSECLGCPNRVALFNALIDQLEYFFHLSTIETAKLDTLTVHNMAAELLKECGIINQGFDLLISALAYSVLEPELLQNLSRCLYPKIARLHHTTASRIERNIRTSIESAWTHGDVNTLSKYFGNCIPGAKGKPTNLQFLLVMNEVLRTRCAISPRHFVK